VGGALGDKAPKYYLTFFLSLFNMIIEGLQGEGNIGATKGLFWSFSTP